MRALPFFLALTACGQLGGFADLRDTDTGDTGDTGFFDTGDTEDTEDTGPIDTAPPPPTWPGNYTGTFTMTVTNADIPIPDVCAGQANVTVTTTGMQGSFSCEFALLLSFLGPQSGQVTGSVSGATVSAQATLGMLFTLDELSGSFRGTNQLLVNEQGTVDLEDLGQYNYTATLDVLKQ